MLFPVTEYAEDHEVLKEVERLSRREVHPQGEECRPEARRKSSGEKRLRHVQPSIFLWSKHDG